jgi:hypothetical protein
MNHRDLEITEVIIVINQAFCARLADAVAKLTAAGLEVFSTDEDEGVVSGSIETYKVSELQKIDCVNYVRSVQTYIADFPAGDPRNTDSADDEEGDALEAI